MSDTNTFYATLGCKYKRDPHPYLPARFSDPDGVIEIRADDYEDARVLIHHFARQEWAFMYCSLDDLTLDYYPLGITCVIRRVDGVPVIRTIAELEADENA